jgi:hypothetical protein
MLRVLPLAGAAAVALGALVSDAHAKMITYEVNGVRYAYSTNNREQTLAARRHIEAAKAATTAKAKADAERASNPLVAIFGSPVQREAAQARAALEQARPGSGTTGTGEVTTAARAAPPTSEEGVAKPTPLQSSRVAKQPEAKTEPEGDQAQTKAAAAPAARPQVKSVSFDAASGIKTTFMTDGSVHEEPFDGTMLPSLAAETSAEKSLNAFVEQLRPVGHVETTGSTWTAANPESAFKPKPSRP